MRPKAMGNQNHWLMALVRYVASIRDTDTSIPRYFIFQNQGHANTASIYIINNKYY
jgi:hypothetical protein